MYDFFAQLARLGGTLYFFVIFAAVVVYALWPRNADAFREAANIPLNEKEPGDE
jgi:cytochrome c oxidase cbb3-type subunit 4